MMNAYRRLVRSQPPVYVKVRSDEVQDDEGSTEKGYDCEFIEPGPTDDHKCPCCFLVVRDAYQVNCCGKILCRNCFFKARSSSFFQCPCCRESLGNNYFRDTRSNREIQSMKVYCPSKRFGCVWTGELREMYMHSQRECLYQNVKCDKCSEQMLKSDLQDHESDKCAMRISKCPLCNEEGTYTSIMGEHAEKCPKVVLVCKNQGCNEEVERCLMSIHCSVCPIAVVRCPYQDIGCTYSTERQSMEKHVKSSTELHLSKAVSRIRELQPRIFCPSIISFSGFNSYKANDKCWYSPCIYTHKGGYKFRLFVYPNGNKEGEGTHISVYINIMPGEYDDTLEWPLRADFFVYLMNQLEDNDHYKVRVPFDDNTPDNYSHLKEQEDGNGWGKPKFLSLFTLEHTAKKHGRFSQYLDNDVIYFKVDVNLLSTTTKPWLRRTKIGL